MHHPPFSVSLHGGNRDLRERWTPLFEQYHVSAVFSGHDHVYSRAEHNGIRYFVSGGGGAPLYPRRPRSHPIDLEAVKKFERVFHYLRVTVTGNRVEVTAIRADGTTIETTSWTEGPPATGPTVTPPQVAASGARRMAPAGPPALGDEPAPARSQLWVGLAGVGLLLAAAVVVVRTLRR